ncbi:MAG: YiiX/YebB-like N1pC/P60 family cysteine hydrolase [Burkholderiaceae bacterium]
MTAFAARIFHQVGRQLARHLAKPLKGYSPPATTSPQALLSCLEPGDVLLVEGDTRVSVAIKYLTQSTWSHAALYVGTRYGRADESGDMLVLVEADVLHGVRAVPLSKYADFHSRICRPVGLEPEKIEAVLEFALARIGHQYDLKNLVDLARYLLPMPAVPTRSRRRMLALGSGEPSRAICSTLIAQAFQSVRYPILPYVEYRPADTPEREQFVDEVLRARHHSLFTPRDFDISPYFRIVKPRIEASFDPTSIRWTESDPVPLGTSEK